MKKGQTQELDDFVSLDMYIYELKQRLKTEPKNKELKEEIRWAKAELKKISERTGIPIIS